MFTLVSEHGNVQKIAESEHKRDELISKGYKLIDPDPAEEPKKRTAPKGKGKNAKTEE